MKPRFDDPSDEELILYHYGEGSDRAAVAGRLAVSPAARERYAELQRLLAAVDAWTPPDLPADFEDDVWRRLQPRLAATRPSGGKLLARASRFRHPGRWLPSAVAAVLLLVLGFIAGRFAPPSTPGAPREAMPAPPQSLSVEARDRLLVETLAGHLERSQRLFTELENHAPGSTGASGALPARDLLAANRLYRAAAERGGRRGTASLLAQLEPILLELSNLPADPQPADLEYLRQRVEAQGLLFKTRVASGLLDRSLQARPAPAAQSTL